MSYKRGARRERELLEELGEHGFVGLRAPSSGSTTQRELPDLLVGKNGTSIAFEVKTSADDRIYLDKDEVNDLEFFSEQFGAEWWIAIKFNYVDWMFVKREQMHETEKSYRCDEDMESYSIDDILKCDNLIHSESKGRGVICQ